MALQHGSPLTLIIFSPFILVECFFFYLLDEFGEKNRNGLATRDFVAQNNSIKQESLNYGHLT